MSTVFGISTPALFGQLLIGLINGSFYAILSLGLAVIFGMLRVINFAHGAQYMLGAFVAWFLLQYTGIGFWPALIAAPLVVAAVSIVIERTCPPLSSSRTSPTTRLTSWSWSRPCGSATPSISSRATASW